MKLSKKAKMSTEFLVIIGIAAVVLFQGGFFGNTQSASGGTTTSGGQTVNKIELDAGCDKSQQTTLTVTAFDMFDSGVTVGGNHLWRYDGGNNNAWQAVNDGASITTSPEKKIEFLIGNSTMLAVKTPATYTVPCTGSDQFSAKVYRNGTTSIRIFNQDNGNLNSATDIETLAIGDVVNLAGDLQGQYQRGRYANGGCAIAEYDSLIYDDVRIGFNGVDKSIPTPSYYTVMATNRTTKSWEVPPVIGNTILPMNIMIDTDDVIATPADTGDINITFIANEYRVNTDTNQLELFKCGADQDGARLAPTIAASSVDLVELFID